jgi:hypothetical protein
MRMNIMTHRATFGRIIFCLALLLMFLSMTSCTLIVMSYLLDGPEKLAGTQKERNYRGGECRNVLMIGFIENTSRRVWLENAFIDRFTQPGLQPIVGSIIFPDLASLKNRAIIDKIVREEKIDKVITIEVKDIADKDMPGWLGIWLATPLPKGDLTDVAPAWGVTKNVRFEIGLWDVKALKREWTGTTHPVERFEMLQHAYETADSTVYTLNKEKILRPGK